MAQIASALERPVVLHFARDDTFRELKADNVVLVGHSQSNPWIEPFENRLTIRWKYNDLLQTYYPVDTSARIDVS